MSAVLAHLLAVLAAWTLSIGSAASISAGGPGLADRTGAVEGAPGTYDLGCPVELAELEEEEEDPSEARGRDGLDEAIEGMPPPDPGAAFGPVARRGVRGALAACAPDVCGRGPRAPPV